jgi:hypothetical protein
VSDPVHDLKHELLAAAERRHRAAAMGSRGRLRAATRVLLVAVSATIVTALALVVSVPRSDSPGLLEKAQAALTTPPDTIRHDKWEIVSTSTAAGCTVTRGPTEVWIDERPPYRWRAVVRDLPVVEEDVPADVTVPDCFAGVTTELGGTADPVCTASGCEPILHFHAPNTLRVSPISASVPPDPVHGLRDAIHDGLAHDDGATQLHGRTVEHIRIDPPPCDADRACPPPVDAYVDPDTFYPVEIDQPAFRGVSSVVRFLTFEYLPRTPANLALTNIRAQHPDAVVAEGR